MKKSIIFGICFFIGFSLLELFATNSDFDFYIEFMSLQLFGTVVVTVIFYFMQEKCSGTSYNESSYVQRGGRNSMAILDSRDSLVLGDIEITPKLTRREAEDVLSTGFWFRNKTDDESREYHDSVRVMFLFANIYDEPHYDVKYSFVDYSLFQKYDGTFFLVDSSCAPFAGGQTLVKEFSRDFLSANSKEQVLKTFNYSDSRSIFPSKDFDSLFENRFVSFYAEQRYLCFDYRVLFYYHSKNEEQLKEDYKKEIAKAEKCIDSEIIKAHLTAEYEKALAALKEGTWEKLEWKDYMKLEQQEISEYKNNRK